MYPARRWQLTKFPVGSYTSPSPTMSLYYEAARLLSQADADPKLVDGSLKSRIYGNKGLKNKPAHVYALVSEAWKWSSALATVIEESGLLADEKKLTPQLVLLLAHDLLLSKKGIAAPKDHILRKSIDRHKARLSSALSRERIRCGFVSLEGWRESLNRSHVVSRQCGVHGQCASTDYPRWVRINGLKSTLLEEYSNGVLVNWTQVPSVVELVNRHKSANGMPSYFTVDSHIPDLIATPPATDLTDTKAYKTGRIILQDKASCFPAVLLEPPGYGIQGDIIDACAAPGNKTTHLAALVAANKCCFENDSGRQNTSRCRRIFAVERNVERGETLEKMIRKAGAEGSVESLLNQDFLKTRVDDERFSRVTSILLDPSCSGSGMKGRDLDATSGWGPLVLPVLPKQAIKYPAGKKRSIEQGESCEQANEVLSNTPRRLSPQEKESENRKPDTDRLARLQSFQISMLKHAMSFPQCSRIVYSTCSVHDEENEIVIAQALNSKTGFEYGVWKPIYRERQPPGIRTWTKRGKIDVFKAVLFDKKDTEQTSQACIRCEKGTGEGTMGFFLCGLERTTVPAVLQEGSPASSSVVNGDEESNWNGFDD